MIRILLIVLCLLIFPWTPCQAAENVQLARMNPWVAGSVATTTSCTTSNDTELINQGSNASNSSLKTSCIATRFDITANTYISEMLPNVYFYDGAADMTCSIFTVVDSKPGVEVAGTSVTNNINSTAGFKSMIISPSVLLTGTSYYVVCKSLGSTAAIWYKSDTGGHHSIATNTTGSCGSWGVEGGSNFYVKINGCSP